MNRRERRARDKAFRCLDAATFIPAGVRAKLPGKLLQDMAAHKGRTLDTCGVVRVSLATTPA